MRNFPAACLASALSFPAWSAAAPAGRAEPPWIERSNTYTDRLLAQGLLPPDLMRSAVLEEFVPSQQK
jgi:hypothetical protein